MIRDSTAPNPAGTAPEPASTVLEAEPEPKLPELPPSAPAAPPSAPDLDPSALDPDALKVVYRLLQHGHQAYLVGGCVRDALLGRKPKDFDIATSAHPGEVRSVFRNCRLIGRRFRLAHVYFKGGKIIEVSTFRANPTEVEEAQAELELGPTAEEGESPEADLPENVAEVEQQEDLLITQDNVFGTAEQDARRRDFTMNGLFYDVASGKVLDYVRGLRDLSERQIRTIGDPEVRMREDPVRILRAVRFACKLDLDIESRTYAAMEGAVEDLPRCAPPRLLEETFRLIRGGVAAPSIRLLQALDALKLLLAPLDEHLRKNGPEGEAVFYRFAEALDRRVCGKEPLDDALLLAALLLPLARAAPVVDKPEEGGRPAVAQVIETLLSELVRTSRLPRRIAERCRMILIAQRILSGERKRRGSLAGFRQNQVFGDALTVFEILVDATGQYQEQLEMWKAGGAPTPVAGAEGPKRRRRRRRGGGRSPGGAGAKGGGGET
jgi:poly(A) polymerase